MIKNQKKQQQPIFFNGSKLKGIFQRPEIFARVRESHCKISAQDYVFFFKVNHQKNERIG